ncbi:hypothetical protein Taro_025467 [Colocasia esculenta]|uniref:Uncharacterized protein n=1 Tax=Colocasia esculenta TaxID=4460 RepID=A0A843V3F1_COLES|nr:hypothetical protein [Colocasia esculenta]
MLGVQITLIHTHACQCEGSTLMKPHMRIMRSLKPPTPFKLKETKHALTHLAWILKGLEKGEGDPSMLELGGKVESPYLKMRSQPVGVFSCAWPSPPRSKIHAYAIHEQRGRRTEDATPPRSPPQPSSDRREGKERRERRKEKGGREICWPCIYRPRISEHNI